jgi:hypothetical protein
MYVSCNLSYSTLFHSDLLHAPSELVLHSNKCLMFLSALGRDLGTYGTCMSGVKAVKVRAIICCVECISASFLTFFFSLWRTLSESQMALHWGGCVPGVRT